MNESKNKYLMKRSKILSFWLCLSCTGLWGQQPLQPTAGEAERTLSADSLITKDARLDSLFQTIPEVMITGERPVVKAESGKLVYNLPQLLSQSPADNAYEAVKQLPGVSELNGGFTLGMQSATVVIDGKVTTLSHEQVMALLRSLPADRLANAEVMYQAPARYQVRGALINLTLKRATAPKTTLQGEVYASYAQQHNGSTNERLSLLYAKDNFSVDLLYSYGHANGWRVTDKEALHTINDGTVHDIRTLERSASRDNDHTLRLGADYAFSEHHRLSMVYNGQFTNRHLYQTTGGTQVSDLYSRGTGQLHNFRLDYQLPTGTKAGAEFTYFTTPSHQRLESILEDATLRFETSDRQRINRWKLFLSQEHGWADGWGLNYGAVYTTGIDHSYQTYLPWKAAQSVASTRNGQTLPEDMQSRKQEQTVNLYAGFTKSWGQKLTLDASLAAEYYHTPVWNQWDWFPALNLTYLPADGHMLQLSANSDKSYPDYWAVQDAVSYSGGGYSEIWGNPVLKPEKNYQLALSYILQNKYVFTAWYNHNEDYIQQTLYQSPERLVEIYRHFNFDFQQQAGLQVSLPFRVKNWLQARFSLTGAWMREKDSDFWDIPFDRRRWFVVGSMHNTFTLSTRPDVKLTVSGQFQSKANQGTYTIPAMGHLDLSLRYTFARKRAVLRLYGNDLFETQKIAPRIRYHTQHVTNRYSCFREVGVSFTYRFGGYQEKRRAAVDTSRFK